MYTYTYKITVKPNTESALVALRGGEEWLELEETLEDGSEVYTLRTEREVWLENREGISEYEELWAMDITPAELVIIDPDRADKAWELLNGLSEHGAGLFGDDNGGDPDGPSWIVAASELDADELAGLLENDLARSVDGFVARGYTGTEAQRDWLEQFVEWCGFTSRDVAYYVAH